MIYLVTLSATKNRRTIGIPLLTAKSVVIEAVDVAQAGEKAKALLDKEFPKRKWGSRRVHVSEGLEELEPTSCQDSL